jgi:hypothetical protein
LGEQFRSWRSSLCSFFPLPCYLVPLRPKYSPQYPILKHPQPTLIVHRGNTLCMAAMCLCYHGN